MDIFTERPTSLWPFLCRFSSGKDENVNTVPLRYWGRLGMFLGHRVIIDSVCVCLGGTCSASVEERNRDPSWRTAAHPERGHRDSFLWGTTEGQTHSFAPSYISLKKNTRHLIQNISIFVSHCRPCLQQRHLPWGSTCLLAPCSSPAHASLTARTSAGYTHTHTLQFWHKKGF